MTLEEIKKNRELVNVIDWDMTPEEAVRLYLEWGNNWSHGSFVKSKRDISHYFVVDTWNDPPTVFLIRRNSDEAVELARFHMPDKVRKGFMESVAGNKGVYGLTAHVRDWLRGELDGEKERQRERSDE